jgi:peptidyl-prolyl cis-trans isomerase C
MNSTELAATRGDTAYSYHLLRAGSERFQRNLASLDEGQRREAERLARRTFALEERVLASDEAQDILIPAAQLEQAIQDVQARYHDIDEFAADLRRNRLDPAGLRHALRRELTFDAVMQRVGARHDPISETDERLFYELHRERFKTPEQRSARHILITINDDFAENSRDAARARLEQIAATLNKAASNPAADGLTGRFARQARRYSECPTAMEDGKLGSVVRGQLYPELDAVLFALPEGGVSGIVESQLGFHLILCERIQPARDLPFNQVRDRLHDALDKRARRDAQRAWLAELHEREAEMA